MPFPREQLMNRVVVLPAPFGITTKFHLSTGLLGD
jgi:hypothetical protein